MINVAVMFLLGSMQDPISLPPNPIQISLECKIMDVPSLAGKEISISAFEPKVTFAASTIVQSAPIIRTIETMPASISVVGADGKGDKISMIPTRTKDGRYGLHVEIVNASQGKSSVQKVDVTLNAREWVQIIGKSRKRVVTIRVVPMFD